MIVARPFKAGDRIQVGDSVGDVLDIGSFSTTIMEIREWVDADQYTGRILTIPNSFALNQDNKKLYKGLLLYLGRSPNSADLWQQLGKSQRNCS